MKKFLTIMATTVLGTTAIANSNLIAQVHLNNQTKNVINNNVKDNINPFIQKANGLPNRKGSWNIAVSFNGFIYAQFIDEQTNMSTLYYSTDGINFKQVKGITPNQIICAPNGIVYEISYDGGVWYSTDGINFQKSKTDLPAINIGVWSNGTVYVGTNGDGLYYSTDGINFQQVNGIDGYSNFITDVTVAPNGTIYAGTNEGVWYSTDGINFKQANGVDGSIIKDTILFASNGTIYAADSDGLYYSTDGINFKQVNGLPNERYVNELNEVANGTVYAWASFGGGVWDVVMGLYYSTDGINFKQANGLPNNSEIENVSAGSNGTVYATCYDDEQTNMSTLYYSTDGINFKQVKGIPGNSSVYDVTVSFETVYASTQNGLYYSTDGINFQQVNGIPSSMGVYTLNEVANGTVYAGTDDALYIVGMLNNLISFSLPNYFLNNQFVYDKPTNISISNTYLQSANLDGKNLTLPTNNLNLGVGKHNLVLTLKNEYKQYASSFGGDKNTGVITYNFWIKDAIVDNNYSVNSDTTLYQGLVSNKGNTNGVNIIQTSINKGSSHSADLIIKLQDKLNNNLFLSLEKSYYVSGTVDTNNNFTATGSKVYLNQSGLDANNQFTISTNGIYQLHLVDKVGNIQDTYLELGQENWKLKGTFNDKTFDTLKTELNVTVDVTGQDKEKQAMAWLNQYKIDADNTFTAEAKKYAAGFNITVADLPDSYITFLDSTTYTDQGGTEKININELDNAIKEVVQKKINSGLNLVNSLTKKYNISTNNVIDSNSLNSYINWINNYGSWFNKNKTIIITNEIDKVSHGYASQSEIKNILANINISNIFNNVNWNVKTDSYYQQFINYQNLDQAILKADSSQTWEAQYQADLKIQESNLNLHGYTIVQILGNKQEPQTKSQMENYDNSGESFHTWLQTEANSKYHKYQLDTGLEIGLPLFVLVSLISLTWYYRNTKKYKLFVFKRTNIKNKEKVDD